MNVIVGSVGTVENLSGRRPFSTVSIGPSPATMKSFRNRTFSLGNHIGFRPPLDAHPHFRASLEPMNALATRTAVIISPS
jgi:hypothetical protein